MCGDEYEESKSNEKQRETKLWTLVFAEIIIMHSGYTSDVWCISCSG